MKIVYQTILKHRFVRYGLVNDNWLESQIVFLLRMDSQRGSNNQNKTKVVRQFRTLYNIAQGHSSEAQIIKSRPMLIGMYTR